MITLLWLQSESLSHVHCSMAYFLSSPWAITYAPLYKICFLLFESVFNSSLQSSFIAWSTYSLSESPFVILPLYFRFLLSFSFFLFRNLILLIFLEYYLYIYCLFKLYYFSLLTIVEWVEIYLLITHILLIRIHSVTIWTEKKNLSLPLCFLSI